MSVNRRCLHLRLGVIFLLAIPIFASAYGQPNEQKIFGPVPKQLRAQLAERLKLLLEYERQQRWNEQYSLLSSVAVADETKEAYTQRRQESREQRILSFIPKYTALMYEGRWEIFGCVKVMEAGKMQELQGEVATFWENGEWRFSQVFFDNDRCSR